MPEPIPIKDHENENAPGQQKADRLRAVGVAITCALVVRMYVLQVVQYDCHSTMSENNRVHVLPITPTRGLIYDRNGVVLADNRPSYNLTITRERTAGVKGELDDRQPAAPACRRPRAVRQGLKAGAASVRPVTLFCELSEEQIAVSP
jgi:penicillin-binding protein 2